MTNKSVSAFGVIVGRLDPSDREIIKGLILSKLNRPAVPTYHEARRRRRWTYFATVANHPNPIIIGRIPTYDET